MTNRRRITDDQMDVLLGLLQRTVDLARRKLIRQGTAPEELDAADERAQSRLTPLDAGSEIELAAGQHYMIDCISPDRKTATLRKIHTDTSRPPRFSESGN